MLATIKPRANSDKHGIFNVYVKVLLIIRSSAEDKILCKDYNKMFQEKENYEFLCYCPDAKIGTKKVAFLAYKTVTSLDIPQIVEVEGKNLKRNSETLVEIIESPHRKQFKKQKFEMISV